MTPVDKYSLQCSYVLFTDIFIQKPEACSGIFNDGEGLFRSERPIMCFILSILILNINIVSTTPIINKYEIDK